MRALVFGLLFLATSVQADEHRLTLTVKIDGAKPSQGQIIATLFDSEADYLKIPLAETTIRVDEYGQSLIQFEGLIPGEYAVSLIYDKNANGKLDTGFLGIPKEKVGFSNNAKGSMGPASYNKAKFMLTSENTNIGISLTKPK